MIVCSKCGSPSNTSGVCQNCGSTNFIEIGRQNVNVSHADNTSILNNPNLGSRYVSQQKPASNSFMPNTNYWQKPGMPVAINHASNVSRAAGKKAATAAGVAIGTSNTLKIVLPIIFALIALIAAIAIPVAVTSTNTPEKTIHNLETALNDLDINGAVECFDSKLRNAYSAGDEIMSGLLGFGYQSFGDFMPFLSEMMGDEYDTVKFDIEVLSKEKISDTSCILNVRITISDGSDYTDSVEEGEVEMVKEDDGKWYICSDDLIDELGSEIFY